MNARRSIAHPFGIGIAVAIALFAPGSLSKAPAAQFTQQGDKLVGTGITHNAPEQGYAVAVSGDGDTMIMGGPYDGLVNGNWPGATWIFTRSNGVWTQQGTELVGAGGDAVSRQGYSVALSGDGNTAIVGGPYYNSDIGAAWVFTRGGGIWTQQGPLLAVSDDNGFAYLGWSVALSADGNTAIVGGAGDSAGAGAAWIFTRSGGVWTQQGPKLRGSNPAGAASGQGAAVALSGDGNTAIVGGNLDFPDGAAWIFTRSNGVWTQQGSKLVGSNAVNGSYQGWAVALSNDGNTALVGGYRDNDDIGAAWVYTRSNGVWTQQGSKLVGTGASGNAYQGNSVALSADGNTAIIGGSVDAGNVGAVWVFRRYGGTWFQDGAKFRGTGFTGTPALGSSVALSGDGSTLIVGGAYDNNENGAAWVFTSPRTAAHSFSGGHTSDILWRNSNGALAAWRMSDGQVSSSTVITSVPSTWSVVGQRDFNGDGGADILWRDTSGNVAIWTMDLVSVLGTTLVANVPTSWTIVGTGDFNGDGFADILWRDTNGNVAVWLMNGTTVTQSVFVANVPTSWTIVGSAGNRIYWRDTGGNIAEWTMNGGTVLSSVSIGKVPTSWLIVGIGDFNDDGVYDLLWRDTGGNVAIWLLTGSGQVLSSLFVANVPIAWSVAETGDFNGDGRSDILWHDAGGDTAIWLMNSATVLSNVYVSNVPTSWSIQGAGAD